MTNFVDHYLHQTDNVCFEYFPSLLGRSPLKQIIGYSIP